MPEALHLELKYEGQEDKVNRRISRRGYRGNGMREHKVKLQLGNVIQLAEPWSRSGLGKYVEEDYGVPSQIL